MKHPQERITSAEFRRRAGASPPEQRQVKAQIRLPVLNKMNKVEAEYFIWLKREFQDLYLVQYESLTLRLPSGTNYTPDFVVWNVLNKPPEILLVVETKGAHIHSSASIRAFKEARAAFPWLKFRFAQKTKQGWATAE